MAFTRSSALHTVAIAVVTTDQQITDVKESGRKRCAEDGPADSNPLKKQRLEDGHHTAQESDVKRQKLSDSEHKSISEPWARNHYANNWWTGGWWDWDEKTAQCSWSIDGAKSAWTLPGHTPAGDDIITTADGTQRAAKGRAETEAGTETGQDMAGQGEAGRHALAALLRRPATTDFYSPELHPSAAAAAAEHDPAATSATTTAAAAAAAAPAAPDALKADANSRQLTQAEKDAHATYMRFYRSIRSGHHSMASLYTVCVLHQTLI
jgi:hypothetical protein